MRKGFRRMLVSASTATAVALAVTSAVVAHAAAAGCQVTYAVSSQWSGGFGANVTITNLGDPITGWTLRWSYAAGQTVTQAWNATVTSSGSAVTAKNVSYNGKLSAGGGTTFGFLGSWTGTNSVPTLSCTAS